MSDEVAEENEAYEAAIMASGGSGGFAITLPKQMARLMKLSMKDRVEMWAVRSEGRYYLIIRKREPRPVPSIVNRMKGA